jgi:hypothetical protein
MSRRSGAERSYQRMSSPLWRDLSALVASAGLAGKIPGVKHRFAEYVQAYDQAVSPVVSRAFGDGGVARYADNTLCESCVKLCFMLDGYARVAGVPFRADLAALGGALARVYDDVIDEFTGGDTAERLSVLFAGGAFVPGSAVERLLTALYRELERRLARTRDDPIYRALAELHECQLRSRCQRDPAIPSPALAEVTRAKGGHAAVVLFALMRAGMSERETALIHRLGGELQLLDDYVDVTRDRRAGFATLAVRGEYTLADICRQLRELREIFLEIYGQAQPLYGVIYLNLWLCFLRRWWPGWIAEATPSGALVRHVRSKRLPDPNRPGHRGGWVA